MVHLLAPFGISSRRPKLSKLWKGGSSRWPGKSGYPSEPLELPQEVIDYIVDFLHDDTAALVSCSILSHQWNDAARYHIFSSLELSGRQRLQGFETFIRQPNSIAVHVHSLRINGQYPNLRPIVTPWALAAILISLPHLRHLSLFHVHHTDHKSSPRLPSPKGRFSLQTLDLAYGGAAVHHAPEHFLDVLGIFSEIDTLTLQYLRFEPKPIEAGVEDHFDAAFTKSIPKDLRVKKLVIDDVASGTEFWLEILRRTAAAKTLTTVHILTSFPWDPAPLGSLLSAVGPNLTSLKLDVSGIMTHMADPIANIADRLSLSSCTELKYLTIRATPAVILTPTYLTALCVLIAATAGHNTLETFTFTCNHSGRRADIFRALCASSALRKVTFVDDVLEKVDEEFISSMEKQLRETCTELPSEVHAQANRAYEGYRRGNNAVIPLVYQAVILRGSFCTHPCK